MCGIAGYINPEGIQSENIAKMSMAVLHRGPDDSGLFIFPFTRFKTFASQAKSFSEFEWPCE